MLLRSSRALAAIALSFSIGLIAPTVLAQDDDLDLDVQESESFDDLEQELDQAGGETASPPAESTAEAPPAEQPPAQGGDDLDDELLQAEENKKEEVPATVEPEQPQEEVAEPAAPAPEEQTVDVPPPTVEEPTAEAPPAEEEPTAEAPPPQEEESPVFRGEYDSPDEEFEARLSRIYTQFYSQRTSDAEWVQIVGPKASEKYVVQNGDTLWGISQTFFGNGFFWPKLWQLNSDYTNPHLLEVADSIQFSPGTIATEPTVNLTQRTSKFNEPDPPKASVTPEQAKAYMANVQMPAPPPYRPVVKEIPNSLPLYQNVSKGYDDSGFSLEKVKRFDISDTSFLGASVSESFPPHDGEVIEAETGGSQVNLYQEAVVELDRAQEKDRFYAFKVGDKVSNEYGSGFPIEYQGELEVLESLGGRKYRVICLETISPINVGSLLRKGRLPKANFSKSGTPGNASGYIIGGHYDSERFLLGTGNLVYIRNRGTKTIQPGQLVTILKDYKLRNPATNLKEPAEPIGLVKIVHVSGGLATGWVVESREDLRPGDPTGPGDIY